MSLLTALFHRPVRHHYALLDEDQCCRMLLTAVQPPERGNWVQVDEICLGWIGRPLPHQARQSETAVFNEKPRGSMSGAASVDRRGLA